MLNIVIPMAGKGSRFANAGYKDPKPLISIGDKPMIGWVIDNIRPKTEHRFIFICQELHLSKYPEIIDYLQKASPSCEIVKIRHITKGAACTVLEARSLIDNNDPLMIANSDQFVDVSIDDYLSTLDSHNADGLIMTFWADDPKWSFCLMNDDRTVAHVVEKEVVSNEATVGIYNFARGSDFVGAADTMIRNNQRVNGEFYVAPVYNTLISQGAKIMVYHLRDDGAHMHGLGTPDDLKRFILYKKIPNDFA